jgi:hypothetical protein
MTVAVQTQVKKNPQITHWGHYDLPQGRKEGVEKLARMYLGKGAELGENSAVSTDVIEAVYSASSGNQKKGYCIVNCRVVRQTAVEGEKKRYEGEFGAQIVREFVDHDRCLAGFSWRRL